VVLISDGRADRWAAAECDIVFAREPLFSILRSWGRPRRLFPFADFDEVRLHLAHLP
jgi:2-hydroxy-3-keto-5-methylthiopentenyl-1-phosphate phosphatase